MMSKQCHIDIDAMLRHHIVISMTPFLHHVPAEFTSFICSFNSLVETKLSLQAISRETDI